MLPVIEQIMYIDRARLGGGLAGLGLGVGEGEAVGASRVEGLGGGPRCRELRAPCALGRELPVRPVRLGAAFQDLQGRACIGGGCCVGAALCVS